VPKAALAVAVLVQVHVLVQLKLRLPALTVTSDYVALWRTNPFTILWHGFGRATDVMIRALRATLILQRIYKAALQQVPDGNRRVAGFTKCIFGIGLSVCASRSNVAILSSIRGEVECQLLLFVRVQGTVLKISRDSLFSKESNESIVICCVKPKVPDHETSQASRMLILEFFLERLCIVKRYLLVRTIGYPLY
jgi:hypothetical protein